MQFRRLTGLERDRIEREYNELLVKIADLEDILGHHERVMTNPETWAAHERLPMFFARYGRQTGIFLLYFHDSIL